MKIYAIYDRMLRYTQAPFIAPDEKQVLAALAQTINAGDKTNAFAQAPHHFELWEIGEIDETANVRSSGQITIATLDSLLRGSLRENTNGTGAAVDSTTGERQGQTGRRTEQPG